MKNENKDHCYAMCNIQNAIANIMDAQGEEIKKIIELEGNHPCILDINKVINKNIYQLTIFENSLYDNLKIIQSKPTCECDIDGGTF